MNEATCVKSDHFSGGYADNDGTLKVYVPDGHLADGGVRQIWTKTGLPFPEKEPGYVVVEDGQLHGEYGFPKNHVDRLVIVLRRPHDIPKSVRSQHSVGLTGADFIYDRLGLNPNRKMNDIEGMGMYDLANLGCRPANILAAFPASDLVKNTGDVRTAIERYAEKRGGRAVVATEFPRMTRFAMVDMFGVPDEYFIVEETAGKTEQWASVKDADWVVDVAEEGNSMYRSGLRAARPGVLMPTTPHAIVKADVYAAHTPVVEELVARLKRGAEELMLESPHLFANKLRSDIFAGE